MSKRRNESTLDRLETGDPGAAKGEKWCSYCKKSDHNDAECWCTRPVGHTLAMSMAEDAAAAKGEQASGDAMLLGIAARRLREALDSSFPREDINLADVAKLVRAVLATPAPADHGAATAQPEQEAQPVAVQAERDRCAAIADSEAHIRTKAGEAHPEDSPARDRCWAGARAAINVARGIRSGEAHPSPAPPIAAASKPEAK